MNVFIVFENSTIKDNYQDIVQEHIISVHKTVEGAEHAVAVLINNLCLTQLDIDIKNGHETATPEYTRIANNQRIVNIEGYTDTKIIPIYDIKTLELKP